MNYTVVPDSENIGTIRVDGLKDAIMLDYCLFATCGIRSTIHDEDGYVVSEKEHAEFIFKYILS